MNLFPKLITVTCLVSAFAATSIAAPIKGTVTYKGTIPEPVVTKTGKYKKVCGATFTDESLLVEKNGVQNVVAWLSGKDAKKKLKGKPGTFTLDQKKCRYEPHITVMSKGSELEILSSDPINHNIHTYSFDNDPINIMFTPGQDHIQEFEEPEPVKVECDLHGWMKAWVFVTPNNFYSLSQAGGSFEIPDVPKGKYTLNFWHEKLGEMSQKIVVGDDPLEINVEFPDLNPKVSQKK